MQFLVLANDGDDAEAPERRRSARPAHLALGDEMIAAGALLFGTAVLDENGQMVGSAMVTEFASRADLDAWLAREPYVVGDVWRSIDVKPCQVGPSFAVRATSR